MSRYHSQMFRSEASPVMIDRDVVEKGERHLARRCPKMRKLIGEHGPCGLGTRRRDPFNVLANSIIGQQLSIKAADTIKARVLKRAGVRSRLTPTALLAVPSEELRDCGLSNAKVKWLHAISQRVASGELNFKSLRKLDDQAAIKLLDDLPGVGPWTAEMFLMFALDRLDIFSPGDVGLRNGINLLYNNGKKLDDSATLELAASWAPYRSIASWYLWRITDADPSTWS